MTSGRERGWKWFAVRAAAGALVGYSIVGLFGFGLLELRSLLWRRCP